MLEPMGRVPATADVMRVTERWRALPPGMRDGSFAVLLTFVTQVELLAADVVEGPLVVHSGAFAAITASVAWRRAKPLLAAGLAGAGLVAQTLTGDAEVVGGFIALLVTTYSVASYAGLRAALCGGLLVILGVSTYPLVNDTSVADEIGNLAIFIGAWTLGRTVRSRQVRAVDAENRVVVVEREREAQARAVIAEERGRIARELHDVVAHGVSVMTLQAGAARQTLDRDPEQVRQLLLGVERMGRQALDEMHLLLGVLRRRDGDLALAPPLTLSALHQLVADARETGLEVTCRVEGDRRPLAPGLEVSAYRIVQQALTNTIQHAGAAHAEIVLRYGADALEVIVTDDGSGSGDKIPTYGHGLIGMRERVDLFGGRLSAGPGDTGGWVVTARLPIPHGA